MVTTTYIETEFWYSTGYFLWKRVATSGQGSQRSQAITFHVSRTTLNILTVSNMEVFWTWSDFILLPLIFSSHWYLLRLLGKLPQPVSPFPERVWLLSHTSDLRFSSFSVVVWYRHINHFKYSLLLYYNHTIRSSRLYYMVTLHDEVPQHYHYIIIGVRICK